MSTVSVARRVAAAGSLAFLALLPACREDPGPRAFGHPGHGPGQFDRPRGVAAAAGRLAVVDLSGDAQVLGADGTPERSFPVMPGGSRRGYPLGLLLEEGGGTLVVHTHDRALVRYDAAGKETARWAAGDPGEPEPPMPQRAVRDGDRLFVTEFAPPDRSRVEVFSADGRRLARFGGRGTEAVFARPMGIALDAAGVLWVADASHRLFRFTREGKFLGVVGGKGEGAGSLDFPTGVAAWPGGGVVVCEAGNHRLQRFDASGRSLGTSGRRGVLPGEFRGPYDVAVDPPYLWVADTDNHRVQRLRLDAVAWSGAVGGVR